MVTKYSANVSAIVVGSFTVESFTVLPLSIFISISTILFFVYLNLLFIRDHVVFNLFSELQMMVFVYSFLVWIIKVLT